LRAVTDECAPGGSSAHTLLSRYGGGGDSFDPCSSVSIGGIFYSTDYIIYIIYKHCNFICGSSDVIITTFSINNEILIFIHKYVYNKDKLPRVFSNYFDENSSFHCYDTRQKDHFHTYTVLSDLGKKSVKYKGSKLWNALPLDVKDIKSLQTFKCVLRKYMLHSGT